MCCVYRLGGGERDAAEVMEHPFYTGVDWQVVYDRKVQRITRRLTATSCLMKDVDSVPSYLHHLYLQFLLMG